MTAVLPFPEASDAVLQLEAVSKIYASGDLAVPVLENVDLTLRAGEHVSITGRSGAGKSTLMHLLGCLDRPTSGRRLVAGVDTSTMDDDALSAVRGESIGFVFQSFHLLTDRTIVDNVGLPLEYRNVAEAERSERARGLLERVGLGHRLGHRPNQLSGGEKQRVAIARALVNRPRILLADEPTGNLDDESRSHVLALFEALHRELGFTLVVVTHDTDIAEWAPRRIQVANRGITG
jgi:putative ABC transport system ATP-binding protein